MRAGKSAPCFRASHQGGFALWLVLIAITTLSLAVSALGPVWVQQDKRQRETELLRIGAAYARALAAYRDQSPPASPRFPRELAELTLDERSIGGVRHLRRLYVDPLQPDRPWGLIRDPSGGIRGVFADSDAMTIRQAGGTLPPELVVRGLRYRDWHFEAPPVRSQRESL